MASILYKFVNGEDKTTFANVAQVYSLPTLNEDGSYTPGEWIEPRDGILEEYLDDKDCGANRLHLMKSFSGKHAPSLWKCYVAEGEGLIDESDEKVSYRRVRLLQPVDIIKLAREGKLRGVNLQGANLPGADLRGVNLWGADLRGVNLWGANLRGAYLWGADLRGTDLRETDLWRADFRGANLTKKQKEYATSKGAIV